MKITITILVLILSVLVVSAETSGNEIVGTITVLEPETTPTPTPTQAPSSGGSSGSSGGSGGIATDELFSNIESYCRSEKDTFSDITTTYNFDCVIYEVVLKNTIREYDIMMRVEELKGISKNTPTQPDKEVYKFVNAYVGTKRYESAELKFKVPISWASGKNIQMITWKNGMWNLLETTKIGEDSEFSYFSTKIDHFTNFAIVGEQVSTPQPVVTPEAVTSTPVQTPIITSVPEEPKSGFNPVVAAVFVLVLLVVVYLFMRRK